MATDPNVLEVRVLNSENNTHYYLYVRKDRLEAFYEFLNDHRCPDTKPGMPGLSWAAHCGLDAIFEKRPRKFPVRDIIAWLCCYLAYDFCKTVPYTAAEVELTLEKFSAIYPPDITETA